MARRVSSHAVRDPADHPLDPPSPEGFFPPWLLGVAVVGCGWGAHHALGTKLPEAPLAASGFTVTLFVLGGLTWAHATPRAGLTKHQRLVRGKAVATVALSGAAFLTLLMFGLTWVTGWLTAIPLAGQALGWNIARLTAIRELARTQRGDRMAEAFGLDGARAVKVAEDDDKVITAITPPLGQSAKDVQRIVEPLAAAAKAPVGGTRAVVNPANSQVEITRMKRDVLGEAIPWPGPTAYGQSFAAAPIHVGVRELGSVAGLWFHGKGRRPASHLLIGGVTGSGKGEAFKVVTADAATRTDVLVWLVDTRKPWQTARSVSGGLDVMATTPAETGALIAAVRKLVPHRSRKLGEAGYDQWAEGCGTPAVLLWVEEAASVFAEDGAWVDWFVRLAEEARSVGVFLVVSLQRPSHDNINTSLRFNLGSGWCFGMRDQADAEFVLSKSTIEAGAVPLWRANKPGLGYLEEPGGSEAEWTQKLLGYLASPEQLVQAVDMGRAVRCPGLPADEAAVMGDVYAKLHRDHTGRNGNGNRKGHGMPAVTLNGAVNVDDDDGTGPLPSTHAQPEPDDAGLDPSQPLPPYNEDTDGGDGLRFTPWPVDKRDLTGEEARVEFTRMLEELAREGTTVVNHEILRARWPYHSRPWISKCMGDLERAGQVRRLTGGAHSFRASEWEIVALVSVGAP